MADVIGYHQSWFRSCFFGLWLKRAQESVSATAKLAAVCSMWVPPSSVCESVQLLSSVPERHLVLMLAVLSSVSSFVDQLADVLLDSQTHSLVLHQSHQQTRLSHNILASAASAGFWVPLLHPTTPNPKWPCAIATPTTQGKVLTLVFHLTMSHLYGNSACHGNCNSS